MTYLLKLSCFGNNRSNVQQKIFKTKKKKKLLKSNKKYIDNCRLKLVKIIQAVINSCKKLVYILDYLF